MANQKVYAPNPEFSGSRRGATFVNGVAEVAEDQLGYFASAGYGIGEPARPAAQPDSRYATRPQFIGTPLRDAAVDPEPSDFLPPVNAGKADPHGPRVVAPEIHHDGPKGIKPGDVFVHDLAQQERRESSLAAAVLIDGQNATEAALEHYDEPTAAGGIDGVPKRNATKAAWVEYAVSHGVDRLEADDMSRDALAERFAQPAPDETSSSSTSTETSTSSSEPTTGEPANTSGEASTEGEQPAQGEQPSTEQPATVGEPSTEGEQPQA